MPSTSHNITEDEIANAASSAWICLGLGGNYLYSTALDNWVVPPAPVGTVFGVGREDSKTCHNVGSTVSNISNVLGWSYYTFSYIIIYIMWSKYPFQFAGPHRGIFVVVVVTELEPALFLHTLAWGTVHLGLSSSAFITLLINVGIQYVMVENSIFEIFCFDAILLLALQLPFRCRKMQQ